MPKSLVEVRRPYTPEAEVAIMGAVHDALVAAFAIPAEDRGVRFVEHPPHRFSAPDGLDHPDAYTLVTIDCFVGRSLDAKRRLYRELGERLAAAGIPPGHTSVILHEIPFENWGLMSGEPASDVDLGFDVAV